MLQNSCRTLPFQLFEIVVVIPIKLQLVAWFSKIGHFNDCLFYCSYASSKIS